MNIAVPGRKSITCGDLNLSHVGQTVSLLGWLHRRRDHGRLIFIDRTRALGPISMQDIRFEHDVTIRRSELTSLRERQQQAWPQRLWLTALDWTVGYGYHVERALFWVVGFILAGVIVLRVSGEGRRHGMPYGLAYSFDLLLPLLFGAIQVCLK